MQIAYILMNMSFLFEFTMANWTPLQVLPRLSRGGDHNPMPITFGTTSTRAPDTPLFAGRPTCTECNELYGVQALSSLGATPILIRYL